MHLIHAPISEPDALLKAVSIRVDRRQLAKRLWRGMAEDGSEFGFELAQPLEHEATVYQTEKARYVIAQEPEPVIEIPLDVDSAACAQIGWSLGNLHMSIEGQAERILVEDDPAVRQLLEKMGVHYHFTKAVFCPGHFATDFHSHGHHHHHTHEHGHHH